MFAWNHWYVSSLPLPNPPCKLSLQRALQEGHAEVTKEWGPVTPSSTMVMASLIRARASALERSLLQAAFDDNRGKQPADALEMVTLLLVQCGQWVTEEYGATVSR